MKQGQIIVADRRGLKRPRSVSVSNALWSRILKRAAARGLTVSRYLCELAEKDIARWESRKNS